MNLKKKCIGTICYFFIEIGFLFAQKSPLAEGIIYKLAILKEGVYKITSNFLKRNGVSLAHIDPHSIYLYSLPGGMLPQKNSAFRYTQLKEVATLKEIQDNRLEYLLFFAEGADSYQYDEVHQFFSHQKNIYTDTNFYFLKIASNPSSRGLSIQNAPLLISSERTTDTYLDYVHHEEDLYNLLSAGRIWLGNKYSFPISQDFYFDIDGIPSHFYLSLVTKVASSSNSSSSFQFSVNSIALPKTQIHPVLNASYSMRAHEKSDTFFLSSARSMDKKGLLISLDYFQESTGNSRSGSGYIDYLTVTFERKLGLYDNQTIFRKMKSEKKTAKYQIENGKLISMIWDITDPLIPLNYSFHLSGQKALFTAPGNGRYIVFNISNLPVPLFKGKISNQNLHRLNTPELLIISPYKFLSEAKRLGAFKQNYEGLKTEVVDLNAIYNEFSSGRQDITAIRDFIRLLYHRSSRLKYILLFGDASYDYKNRVSGNTNCVPVYQARSSFDPIYTYSSDDFYGFLDENEGEWQECTTCTDHDLDVGIGRLPVSTIQQAADVVDKLIRYSSSMHAFGNWRNRIIFIADDEDANVHQYDADKLANFVETQYPSHNVDRLFIDAYPQESTPSGDRSPAVKEKINQYIERGVFIINYSGHGNETGWAEENILSNAQIDSWSNYNAMPLFITATCEFGRYDNPLLLSGAEKSILNAKGGAISLLTTTRPVYTSSNFILNKVFYEELFQPVGDKIIRLGDIMKKTKNKALQIIKDGIINRNFTLLGDPSLCLPYPKNKVAITEVFIGNILSDTLRSLERVKIGGRIETFSNTIYTDFNGLLEVVIYAQKSTFTTLGNQNTQPVSFKNRDHILYRGKSSVKQGQYIFSFIVPKDIDYQFGSAKISVYAFDTLRKEDAVGYRDDIYVGGEGSFFPDEISPRITAYIENPSFQNGMQVPQNSLLHVSIFDESGINISGIDIEHAIIAVLDKNKLNSFILNDFFETKIDDFKRGTIEFKLPDLSQGNHQLTITAWDTHNNPSEITLEFFISSQYKISVEKVIVYPNPATNQVTFAFSHNRKDEELKITIQLYNIKGTHIEKLSKQVYCTNGHVDNIIWKRNTKMRQKTPDGLYIYTLFVQSLKDGASTRKAGKILFLD